MNNALNARIDTGRKEIMAKMFASQILHLLRDYIPDKCRNEAWAELYEAAFKTEAEIITNVTREGKTLQDALDHDWLADEHPPVME